MTTTEHPLTTTVTAAVRSALTTGTVRVHIGRPLPQLEISADANWDEAVAAVHAAAGQKQLSEIPVGLWQRGREALIGPTGVLSPTDLVPHNRTLDMRIHRDGPNPVIVVSWLDGPTVEEVQGRASRQQSGLTVRLVREEFAQLLDDVVEAALAATGNPEELADQPVLERVAAVREGDIYFCLLDIMAELMPRLLRHRRGRTWAHLQDDLDLVAGVEVADAVTEDLRLRSSGGEFFPVHRVDRHEMLRALFVALATTARTLTPGKVRQIRTAVEGP